MSVAYASSGGFAAVRVFTRTETRRQERAVARGEAAGEAVERHRVAPLKPAHCRGLEDFTLEWFLACNKAFVAAMEANPDVRPSAGALNTQNGAGGSR